MHVYNMYCTYYIYMFMRRRSSQSRRTNSKAGKAEKNRSMIRLFSLGLGLFSAHYTSLFATQHSIFPRQACLEHPASQRECVHTFTSSFSMSFTSSSLQLRSFRRFFVSCFCTAPSSACSCARSSSMTSQSHTNQVCVQCVSEKQKESSKIFRTKRPQNSPHRGPGLCRGPRIKLSAASDAAEKMQ